MTPERWKLIEEIFQSALDLPEAERGSFVDQASENDPELKLEVERLLSQFEASSDFIEDPVYKDTNASAIADLIEEERDSLIGTTLGSYKIETEIGRGGMGAVYEAVRADGEFRMRVAIKLIKRGMDTDFILKRFRNERQILATLEHPLITRLIDGGTTDDGRPYFVMDFIEGQPIYEYCDKNRLSINERLELFCRICEAVEYAHENMVIHRDLKPSNILVAKDGSPRLLDFGIAKLLDPEMASDTLQPTATAMRMMTVDYASPEQVRGEQVTFTTDIYSLGVILYELLTGHRPYNFRSRLLEHAAQIISEQEPERPSRMVKSAENAIPRKNKAADEAPTLIMIGLNRHATVEEVSRELAGNLDRVILNALHKAPEERYASVAEFRDDIRRHLEGKQVLAPGLGPDRERGSSSRLATVADNSVAVLPFKLLGTITGDDSAENYLGVGLTDTLITRLSQVGSLIVRPTSSVLAYSEQHTDPFAAASKLSVRYILDGTIRPFGKKLRVSVQMLDTTKESAIWAQQIDSDIGDLLTLEDTISNKVAESILPQITGGERSRLAKRGTESAEAYEAYQRGRYHWNHFTADSLPKALEYFQKAVQLDPNFALAHVGVADFFVWASIYGLIPSLEATMQARFSLDRALNIDAELGEAHATLGLIKENSYEWDEAATLFQKAVELNPSYPNAYEWYSSYLVGTGRTEEGLAAIRRAAQLDPLSLRTKTLVAWTSYQAGEFPEALAVADEIIELDKNFAQGHLQRGYILIQLGRGEEALQEIKRGIELMPGTDLTRYYLAFAYAAAGQIDAARRAYSEMRADAEKRHVKPMFLALAAVAAGETDEAFQHFAKAIEERDPWSVWFGTEPNLEPIRRDSRYLALLRITKNPIIHKIERHRASETRAVAVLPFKLSGEANDGDRYLSVGLADALITRLSGLTGIAVRPTTSVLKYAERTSDPLEAGEALKTDFLLDGEIVRVGDKFRISASLIDVVTGNERWSNDFEEDVSEIFEVEDKVSSAVARSLIPEFSREEEQRLLRRSTNNPEAYAAYLKGRTHWLNSTPDDLAKALVAYNEAIALDPDFAAPYAGIADYHNFLSILGIMAPHDSFPAAKENALKALSLDPGLAEAYVSLSVTAMGYDWDFAESERLVKRALELSPNNAGTHFWHSNLLTMTGESAKAISEIELAESLSPRTPSIMVSHILSLKNARRFEEAQAKIREAIEFHPNHYLVLQTFSWLVKWIGNHDEVEAQCKRAADITNRQNNPLYSYGYALAVIGKRDHAREILKELEGRRERIYVPPIYFALINTALGEIDEAFKWLDRSVAERDFWTPWAAVDPRFDELRDDPRYQRVLEQIGHPLANVEKKLARSNPDDTADTSTLRAVDTGGDPVADTAGELVTKELEARSASGFFYRHRYKWATVGVISVLGFIGYLTGVVSVDFEDRRSPKTAQAGVSQATDTPNSLAPAMIPNSIVVLPFKAEEALDNDLGVGLADSLTSKLGTVKRLTVISGNTGRAVANDEPQKISSDLGVQYVLKSNIVKTDKSYKVFSELYNAQNKEKGWKAEFETKPEELFKVISVLGMRVLESVAVEPLPVEKQQLEKTYTDNGVAYELYLIGRSNLVSRSPEGIRKAISAFNRAKDSDPGFALAYAGLADAYNMQSLYQIPAPSDSYPNAIENAKKALAIDPELAEAHVSLGYSTFFYLRDRTTAELEFRRALQINPSYAQAHSWFSSFLIATNRLSDAVSEVETAKRLDPRALTNGAAMAYFYSKQFAKSIEEVNKALSINSNFLPAIKLLRWCYSADGNYKDAREAYMKERIVNPEGNDAEWYMIEAQVEALNGNKVQVLEKLNSSVEVKSVKEHPNAYAYEIALAYNALGEKEKTFEWLEKAEAAKSYGFNFLEVDHRLDELRNEPRFQKLLQKLTNTQK